MPSLSDISKSLSGSLFPCDRLDELEGLIEERTDGERFIMVDDQPMPIKSILVSLDNDGLTMANGVHQPRHVPLSRHLGYLRRKAWVWNNHGATTDGRGGSSRKKHTYKAREKRAEPYRRQIEELKGRKTHGSKEEQAVKDAIQRLETRIKSVLNPCKSKKKDK